MLYIEDTLHKMPGYKDDVTWSRNLEIENTPFWVLRLGRVRNTSFGTDVSNKMLLNTSKFYAYSFYHSCVIKVKTTWGGEVTLARPPSAAQINVGKFVDVDNVNLLGNLLCKYIKKNFSCKCWLSFCRFLGWIQK